MNYENVMILYRIATKAGELKRNPIKARNETRKF